MCVKDGSAVPKAFVLILWMCCCALPVTAQESLNCEKYGLKERATCENAKQFGLSLHAAHLVEWLAERDFAASFCGSALDPAEVRHRESILAGDTKGRSLFAAHGRMLRERCIYDPDGYCQSMGFARR